MSSFVVDPRHVDYIVEAAFAFGPKAELTLGMRPVQAMTLNELGRALAQFNVEAVAYRYSEKVEPGGFYPERMIDYHFRVSKLEYRPEAVVKAIRCYRYQASDHPAWEGSDIERMLDDLVAVMERSLPARLLKIVDDGFGAKVPLYRTTSYFDELPWEITEDTELTDVPVTNSWEG